VKKPSKTTYAIFWTKIGKFSKRRTPQKT